MVTGWRNLRELSSNLFMLNCRQESMMTILAMVNAEKEGQIESKMIKARQMEEIREARRKEAEARQEQKKTKLVCQNINFIQVR